MPRSIPAFVRPELLVWARESAGLSIQAAAKRTKFDVEDLKAWETGVDKPSIPQLRKLGERYKRPIAVFYLAAPPEGFAPQREFRRLAGLLPGRESPECLQALRWAVFRREAALELKNLLGERPHRIRAALHPQIDAERAGQQIRELLGVTWRVQTAWATQTVKVSPEVILRRLVTLHRATEGVYRRKREVWGTRIWYTPPFGSGGPPVEVRTIASDGRGYTQLVMTAFDQRLITTSAASDYLGVKPRHFENIRRELSIRPSMAEG